MSGALEEGGDVLISLYAPGPGPSSFAADQAVAPSPERSRSRIAPEAGQCSTFREARVNEHARHQASDLLEYVIEMPCDQGFFVIM